MSKHNLPTKVKIIDVEYSIEYCEKPSDVDIRRIDSQWGQIDYWTRSIRIYAHDKMPLSEIRNTLFHEVLHGISHHLKINTSDGRLDDNEDAIHLLATGLNQVLTDNKWLRKALVKK